MENWQTPSDILVAKELSLSLTSVVSDAGVTADEHGRKIIPAGTPLQGGDTLLDITQALSVYAPAQSVKVSSIDLGSAFTLANGSTKQLTAKVSPDNATDKSATYTSADATKATVSDTGLVTSLADSGTVNIIATANDGSGVTGTVTVTLAAKEG